MKYVVLPPSDYQIWLWEFNLDRKKFSHRKRLCGAWLKGPPMHNTSRSFGRTLFFEYEGKLPFRAIATVWQVVGHTERWYYRVEYRNVACSRLEGGYCQSPKGTSFQDAKAAADGHLLRWGFELMTSATERRRRDLYEMLG